MNKPDLIRRMTAVALVFSLSLSAAFAGALGDPVQSVTTPLTEGVELSEGVHWSSYYSDRRTEHFLDHRPNESVAPLVTYGATVGSTTSLSAMIRQVEAQGYRVLAGINGDYYNTSTGVPIGIVITEGVLRSGSSDAWAVGFQADGTAFASIPNLKTTLTTAAGDIRLTEVNKIRQAKGGIYLYTEDFSATTRASDPGYDVVFVPDGPLTVGGTVTGTVESVLDNTSSTSIPAGRMVLSADLTANSVYLDYLRSLAPGDELSISVQAADPRWNTVQNAIGGLYQLVSQGEVVPGLEAGSAPRTAIGIRPDGSSVLYTVDGRQSGYSIGATMKLVAQRLIELGCTEAVCLDGGGSTSLSATLPDGNSAVSLNAPSEGRERAVSNHLLLISQTMPTGEPDHLYVSPRDSLLLQGNSVQLQVSGVDTGWYPMTAPEDLRYEVTAGSGFVSADGLFTAGDSTGMATVTVTGGGVSGTVDIMVYGQPDTIQIHRPTGKALSSLTLTPGESLELDVTALGDHLKLLCEDEDFSWSLTGGIGSVTDSGFFTAGAEDAAGELIVSFGETEARIPVTVRGSIRTLEDFENGLGAFGSGSGANLTLEEDRVKYGHFSGKLSYDLSGGNATLAAALPITDRASYLNLWVWGDGSGNSLRAELETAQGADFAVLASLDFDGWQQISLRLPEGSTALTGLSVVYGGQQQRGQICLDQLVLSHQAVYDYAAPVMDMNWNGSSLTATLSDDWDGVPRAAGIELLLDGQPQSFRYDEDSGTLTAAPELLSTQSHRLTLIAADQSGNLSRRSLEIPAAEASPSPFADTQGHWAAGSIDYLCRQGIVNGIPSGEELLFQPDKNISRVEFARILCNWLGLDSSDYSEVTLPFADRDRIPDWALDAVQAMYAMGILKGSSVGGQLVLDPTGSISRQEALTLLARALPAGYAEKRLSFADSGDVANWAAPSVRILTGLGAVSGKPGNLVDPAGTITRGEVCRVIQNLI